MVFIEGLPKSQGFTIILVILGRLSMGFPLKHPYSVNIMATTFTKEVVWLHGIPYQSYRIKTKYSFVTFGGSISPTGMQLHRSTICHQ